METNYVKRISVGIPIGEVITGVDITWEEIRHQARKAIQELATKNNLGDVDPARIQYRGATDGPLPHSRLCMYEYTPR